LQRRRLYSEEEVNQYISQTVAQAALLGKATLKEAVRAFERDVIVEALKENNDDKRKVAQLLGLGVSSLYRKLTEFS
jgi:transcriptional regulator with PAS, ATPase and Fis domain